MIAKFIMNIMHHINELRFKIIYYILGIITNFFTTYFYAPQIIKLISIPFFNYVKKKDFDFIFTSVLEVFNTYVLIAFYNSIFFSTPILFYFIYNFLKPGLYKYEKDILFDLFIFIIKCVFISLFIVYFIIYPTVLSFLLTLDIVTKKSFILLKMETNLFDYILFTSKCLIFYCFFVFQIPIFICLFIYNKKIKPTLLYKKRRFYIVILLILSCIFSTPDIQNLLIVLFFLLFFFEFVIFMSILENKYKIPLKQESSLNGKRQVC